MTSNSDRTLIYFNRTHFSQFISLPQFYSEFGVRECELSLIRYQRGVP
jgi:hypothetical protein